MILQGPDGQHGSSSWPPHAEGGNRWEAKQETKPEAPWSSEPGYGGRPQWGGEGGRPAPYGRERESDRQDQWPPEKPQPKPWERSEGNKFDCFSFCSKLQILRIQT